MSLPVIQLPQHAILRLAALAIQASMEAPERWSKHGYMGNVRRELIDQMRWSMSAAGYDWRAEHRRRRAEKAGRSTT